MLAEPTSGNFSEGTWKILILKNSLREAWQEERIKQSAFGQGK